MTGSTIIRGVAERVNERGVRINGEWLNVSKFTPVALPPEGAQVVATVDVKGFMTSIQVDQATAAPTAQSRSETISRLAVLKAAANFLGQLSQTREEVRSDHVLQLAEKWLTWVNQPDQEEEDL